MCASVLFLSSDETLRSKLLSGIDPLLISCWACLSHDLYTVVQRHTTISFSELVQQIQENVEELRSMATQHKEQHFDAGVPIAPCLANLVMPLLQERLPSKMLNSKRSKAQTENSADSVQQRSRGSANSMSHSAHSTRNSGNDLNSQPDAETESVRSSPGGHRRWKAGTLCLASLPLESAASTASAKHSSRQKKAAAVQKRIRFRTKQPSSGSASKELSKPGTRRRAKKPMVAKRKARGA
jgi:hypothetical protein